MLTRSVTFRGSVVGAGDQVRERRLGDVEEAFEVEVDHPLPLLDRRVLGRAEQHHPGVVDDGVEAAELGDGALDQRLGLGAVGDVGLDRQRATAGVADLGDQLLQPVDPAGRHRDRRAFAREPLRGRLADAAGGAGDEGHGSVEYCVLGHRTSLDKAPRRAANALPRVETRDMAWCGARGVAWRSRRFSRWRAADRRARGRPRAGRRATAAKQPAMLETGIKGENPTEEAATTIHLSPADCEALGRRAEDLLGAKLNRTPTPKPPLSKCRLEGSGAEVNVYLDAGFAANRRYRNRMTETAQFNSSTRRASPSPSPTSAKGPTGTRPPTGSRHCTRCSRCVATAG